ncbi:DUF2177 family protein [Candidatus Saccharibacteria bacterium]|nr:DUF2177 family protein [Candidatus Saccharibacteria bacterium]
MELLVKLLAAGGIMGILDFVWLGFVAKKLYYGEMGKILLEKPNMGPAILFYIIYVIGVVVFVISPALEKGSWLHALGYGALFGFVAYATYDLTNLATLKGFSSKIVVIDLLWGAGLTAVVSTGAYAIVKAVF